MKFPVPLTIDQVAEFIGAEILGDRDQLAYGINEIHKVEKGDITFVDVEKYFAKSLHSAASIIILNMEVECPPGKTLLICDKPFVAYDSLVRTYRPYKSLESRIDPTAVIHPSVTIEPGVIIGRHVHIGKETVIEAGAVIRDYCTVGERCIIQSGTIIGTDAFYFKKEDGKYTKWTSGGRVLIGDDVYIGANCTINRGVSGDTVIGNGSKLDCLVQIGHGVVLGENCLLAAQVGIAGKTMVGSGCIIYGQVGIAQNLVIGDNVTIGAKSGVARDLQSGKTYFGIPAVEIKEKYREIAALRRLPEIFRRGD